MDVAPAEITVAMGAESTRLPLAQPHWVDWILQAPDHDAVIPRGIRIRVTAHLRTLGGGDQLAVRDVELAAARVLRTGNPVQDLRIGRVGDVQDAPPSIRLRAGVHVPASVDLLDIDLERQMAVQIREANVLDVAAIRALRERPRLRACLPVNH